MDDQRQGAESICDTLSRAGHRALFAGGCVRDLLLGKTPKDYDIATSAKPAEIEGLFDSCVQVGAAFGVQLVVLPQARYEVATFRWDGPYLDGRHPSTVEFRSEKEDALRRDFTVNAMFRDPQTDEIVDYVGGQDDLAAGLIRTVGDPRERFNEDHLRLLRAVRFSANLGFPIEENTLEAMRELAPLVMTTSAERIRDELLRMLTEGAARRAVELLDETNLLKEILPEVAAMKDVEQPPEFHPEGDVFVHTLMLLDMLDSPTPTLAMSALLHDVGKPETQTFEDRIRFNLHEKVGANISEKICRRLHMSNHDTDRVTWLVGQHMRIAAAQDMRESKLKRLVRDKGFAELLELFRLDCLASHGKMDLHEWLHAYAENLEPEDIRPRPLITGNDLIKMGYTPGEMFSEILQAVEDAQLEGKLADKDAAKAFVKENWSAPQE